MRTYIVIDDLTKLKSNIMFTMSLSTCPWRTHSVFVLRWFTGLYDYLESQSYTRYRTGCFLRFLHILCLLFLISGVSSGCRQVKPTSSCDLIVSTNDWLFSISLQQTLLLQVPWSYVESNCILCWPV